MVDWEEVRSLASEAGPMEKLIRGYSYSEKDKAIRTDEKVCHHFVNGIREAKGILFNIIELLYELEKKEPLSAHLQKLKDELDIFSDEVKARYCEWKGLNVKWTVELVKHDHDLITGLEVLNMRLRRLNKEVLDDKALLSGDQDAENRLWEHVKGQFPAIEERIDSLATLFKEREGICNLRPLALDKTFDFIQKRIEKQI